MTPAIQLLPRHAMEVDGPGWLNLFQVTVAGGLLPSFVWAARALQKTVVATRDTIELSQTVAIVGLNRCWLPPAAPRDDAAPTRVASAPGFCTKAVYRRAWKTMLSVLVGLQERSFGTG
jgi:hypothetical protein